MIGALFSGFVFDLSGSYVIAFLTFFALGLVGAVVVSSSNPSNPPNRAVDRSSIGAERLL
jgi:hypothetical protein